MDVALNWLTQGLIVAIVAAAGLRVIPRSRTQARYIFVWVAYLLVLALPALPLVFAAPIDTSVMAAASISTAPVVTIPVAWWSSTAAALTLWSMWAAINAAHFVVGAAAVRNARRQSREFPSDVLAQLPHWSQVSATGRPTRVVLSDRVRHAAVLGCGSPIIALAPQVVARLSVADLDHVLTHEWAHVQRRDDLAQLVQRIVRIIVGWHPAAWWLERQLEFEREVACDERAVSVTGSAKAYAICLATLAALPKGPMRPLPALGVSPSSLRRRLLRILAGPSAITMRPWRAVAVGAGGGLLALASMVSNVNVVAAAVATSVGVSTAAQLVSQSVDVANLVELTRPEPAAAPQSKTQAGEARGSRQSVRPVSRPREATPDVGSTEAIAEPLPAAIDSLPLPSSDGPLDARISVPVVVPSPQPALNEVANTPPAAEKQPTPWLLAADGGVAIGRASRTAGVATSGFFSRFGKKIAGSF